MPCGGSQLLVSAVVSTGAFTTSVDWVFDEWRGLEFPDLLSGFKLCLSAPVGSDKSRDGSLLPTPVDC